MAYKRKSYGRSRSAKRRTGARTTKRTFRNKVAKIARSVVLKQAESKHVTYNHTKIELYHNTNTVIPLNLGAQMPAQGTHDYMRIGDHVNATGFKLRMILGQKADRPNVTFKFRVVKVPKGSVYSYGGWYESSTANVLLDNLNTDFVKSITNFTWKPHDGSMDNATDEYVYTKSVWIPYKKLLKFGPTHGVQTHNDEDMYILVSAFDSYGTLLTDNIAYIQVVQSFYYRDP